MRTIYFHNMKGASSKTTCFSKNKTYSMGKIDYNPSQQTPQKLESGAWVLAMCCTWHNCALVGNLPLPLNFQRHTISSISLVFIIWLTLKTADDALYNCAAVSIQEGGNLPLVWVNQQVINISNQVYMYDVFKKKSISRLIINAWNR